MSTLSTTATRGRRVPARGEPLSPRSCHVCIEERLRCVCESETSPDWLWLGRGHLMHSVNTGTLDANPSLNQPLSGAVRGRHRTEGTRTGGPDFNFHTQGWNCVKLSAGQSERRSLICKCSVITGTSAAAGRSRCAVVASRSTTKQHSPNFADNTLLTLTHRSCAFGFVSGKKSHLLLLIFSCVLERSGCV